MAFPVTFSATEITNCLRGIVFKRQRKVAPPLHPEIQRTLNLFSEFGDVGQRIQAQITEFWRKKGSLQSSGNRIDPKDGFTGAVDAICTIQGKLVLYEVKGVSRSFFEWVQQHREPRSYNKVQLMIYHRALLPQYPGIEPRLLYVSRSDFKSGKLHGIELPIHYSEEEFQKVLQDAERVRQALSGGPLPEPAPAIEMDPVTEKRTVSMMAITCRHHALCLENDRWFEKAKQELGEPIMPLESASVSEEDVPF